MFKLVVFEFVWYTSCKLVYLVLIWFQVAVGLRLLFTCFELVGLFTYLFVGLMFGYVCDVGLGR